MPPTTFIPQKKKTHFPAHVDDADDDLDLLQPDLGIFELKGPTTPKTMIDNYLDKSKNNKPKIYVNKSNKNKGKIVYPDGNVYYFDNTPRLSKNGHRKVCSL